MVKSLSFLLKYSKSMINFQLMVHLILIHSIRMLLSSKRGKMSRNWGISEYDSILFK